MVLVVTDGLLSMKPSLVFMEASVGVKYSAATTPIAVCVYIYIDTGAPSLHLPKCAGRGRSS